MPLDEVIYIIVINKLMVLGRHQKTWEEELIRLLERLRHICRKIKPSYFSPLTEAKKMAPVIFMSKAG